MVPSPEGTILIVVITFGISKYVPNEEYIKIGVHHLCYEQAGTSSGIQVEHLKQWLLEAEDEERLD